MTKAEINVVLAVERLKLCVAHAQHEAQREGWTCDWQEVFTLCEKDIANTLALSKEVEDDYIRTLVDRLSFAYNEINNLRKELRDHELVIGDMQAEIEQLRDALGER